MINEETVLAMAAAAAGGALATWPVIRHYRNAAANAVDAFVNAATLQGRAEAQASTDRRSLEAVRSLAQAETRRVEAAREALAELRADRDRYRSKAEARCSHCLLWRLATEEQRIQAMGGHQGQKVPT